MLIVYFGTDRGAVRDAASSYIEKHLPENGTMTTIEAAAYEPGQVAGSLGASSLFGGAEWIVFDTPSDNDEFKDAIRDVLPELAASSNTFIVMEGALLVADKKAYTKHATVSEEFKAQVAQKFNSFALAEALAARDKRHLWSLLHEARSSGLPDEAIVGMLWWQLKAMRLAVLTKSAAEAGMKDFPYNKAKRALTKFQPGETERLSRSLLELYHDGHAGRRDLDVALERWVLEM